MQKYRIGYTFEGRCECEYVMAAGPAAAEITVEKKHPGSIATSCNVVPNRVENDYQWADQERTK